MKRILLLSFLVSAIDMASAQDHGFAFGNVSRDELQMSAYAPDTTANAVVLNEFGESYIDDGNNYDLIHEYHVKIKIFNEKGFNQASFVIPLRKQNGKAEMISDIQASTFNLSGGQLLETKLERKNVYTEHRNPFTDLVKFTLPNVQPGCVIEVKYRLESPFLFNFREWDFQSRIPKIYSEYWAKIPANYIYNITLQGYYKLDKNQSEAIKDCFSFGSGKADCALFKYAMKDIPAFVDEDYMTAEKNFLSAIHYELSEIRYFNGSVKKFTETWKDVDEELRYDPDFGKQLKKGKEVFPPQLQLLLSGNTSSSGKAREIYDFFKSRYKWNEYYGYSSASGIKKAFENKTGNVGDINLSLIAALQYAGLDASPVLLSTRENGLPGKLNPIISQFNYVVARLEMGDSVFLLDATDPYLPFGLLPLRCLNGQGRWMPGGKDTSQWIDIRAGAQFAETNFLQLRMGTDGTFKGTITRVFNGYNALQKRKEISGFNSPDEYMDNLQGKLHDIKILHYTIDSLHNPDAPLTVIMQVETDGSPRADADRLFFRPFLMGNLSENPFKSSERNYPVDFGAPSHVQNILVLSYPDNYEIISVPKTTALSLPDDGGSYLMGTENLSNQLVIRSDLSLKKPVYSPEEYYPLKELYSRIIQIQHADVIFKRK